MARGITDTSGHRYLDFTATRSIRSASANPRVVAAVIDQLQTLPLLAARYTNRPAIAPEVVKNPREIAAAPARRVCGPANNRRPLGVAARREGECLKLVDDCGDDSRIAESRPDGPRCRGSRDSGGRSCSVIHAPSAPSSTFRHGVSGTGGGKYERPPRAVLEPPRPDGEPAIGPRGLVGWSRLSARLDATAVVIGSGLLRPGLAISRLNRVPAAARDRTDQVVGAGAAQNIRRVVDQAALLAGMSAASSRVSQSGRSYRCG